MEHLFVYLISKRDKLPNQVILDCLTLSRASYHGRAMQYDELIGIFGACNKAHVRTKLRRLKKYDLVKYTPGTKSKPGFSFTRVGPVPTPLPYNSSMFTAPEVAQATDARIKALLSPNLHRILM
jgi:hypothetical protein